MISAKVLIMLTILVYLGGMIIIGIYCSKKNENVGDFYLGGRKLGPFVTAMSAEASDMSSYLLMGAARSGIFKRCGGCWLDGNRACHRYISELVGCRKENPYLYTQTGCHYNSGFLLPSIS